MSAQTLDQLCSLIIDSEHKTAPKDPDGLHPLMRTNNLARARGDFDGAQRVNAQTYALWTKRARPQAGDLILAREAPVGGIGRVPPNVLPVLGQRTVLLRPRAGVADSQFLLYRLAASDSQNRMKELATGATVPHLNMADIRAFALPDVPDIFEQRRRASILAGIDELIALNQRRIDMFEGVARSLYREWFERFRFPGHEWASFTDTPLGRIPEGWHACAVGDVAIINRAVVARADLPEPLRYLDISGVGQGRFGDPVRMSADQAPGRARRLAADGDTIWATVRPNRRAHALVHEPPDDLVISTGLATMTPRDVPSSFLFEYASTPAFADYLVSRTTGSAYPAVRPGDFAEAPIVVPTSELMEAFSAVADPALRAATARLDCNRALGATRDLLLSRLVTGRLDISDIDLGDLLEPEAA